MSGRIGTRVVTLLFVVGIALATIPGVASAATRAGGTVVVAEGETVNGLTAYGGTVVVRGTINGDLTAFGGSVVVTGNVTGSVSAFAGDVRIAGRIGGDVTATGGNVVVEHTAVVAGDLAAAGGSILVAGAVRGNARLAGGSVTLESTATVEGDVEYAVGEDGEFANEGATVGGSIIEREELSIGGPFETPSIPGWTFGLYGFLVNLVLGAILLLVFPGTSREIADRVAEEPLRTGGIGLLALIGVPIALVLFMLTIVGIPLSLAGLVAYVLWIWIAVVYGRFAVGSWLLARADWENRWAALSVGMVVVAILVRVPLVGRIVDLVVLLLGMGSMAWVAYRKFRASRGAEPGDRGAGGAEAPDPAP